MCKNDWPRIVCEKVNDKTCKGHWPKRDGKIVSKITTNIREKIEIIYQTKHKIRLVVKLNSN